MFVHPVHTSHTYFSSLQILKLLISRNSASVLRDADEFSVCTQFTRYAPLLSLLLGVIIGDCL